MYIRLAFAVAAHLDAEILFIDEVLAVGDAAFQKKCLERIRAIAAGGGTVLFVSHNMGTVASLCQSALVLEGGQLIGRGDAREQVRLYLHTLNERSAVDLSARQDRAGTGKARLTDISFLDAHGKTVESALGGEPLTIRFGYRAGGPLAHAEIHVRLCNEHGLNVTMLSNRFTGDSMPLLSAEGAIDCVVPELSLAPGSYILNVSFEAGLEVLDSLLGAARLDVEPGSFFPTGRTPDPANGVVLTRHRWAPAPSEEAARGRSS
jgi:lipopolysaccharide transport system ATP-binding protein